MSVTVSDSLEIDFTKLSLSEKVKYKNLAPPIPQLNIVQKATSRGKAYERKFSNSFYNYFEWICGCEKTNSFYCYVCILFGNEESGGTNQGINDLKNFKLKCVKHNNSVKHINNMVDFQMIGTVNIAESLDSAYKLAIQRHNDQVKKNRSVLNQLINAIRFCGKHELALRGHDEREESENPGIFRSLVDYTAAMDSILKNHLETAKVFKGKV